MGSPLAANIFRRNSHDKVSNTLVISTLNKVIFVFYFVAMVTTSCSYKNPSFICLFLKKFICALDIRSSMIICNLLTRIVEKYFASSSVKLSAESH
jgi:hypothetical protein